MGSETTELGLDLKLCAVKAADGLLRELPTAIAGERAARLEEALRGLEEERGKMEAFKRELPFSIRLVADVVEILKEELDQCRRERCNVIEEFIPIKSKFEEEEEVKLEKDCKDKMNWMSSAQLWSDSYSDVNHANNNDTCKKAMQEESKNLSFDSKSHGGGGAFVPFKALSSELTAATPRNEEKVSVVLPDLSLMSAGMKRPSRPAPAVEEEHHFGGSSSKMRAPVSSPMGGQLSLQAQQLQQTSRKARRCWSPELHRRFVLALQQLGGSQATPKQIRELMKVDGLTNDEVKSHLQKYRLHTRRAPNSSTQGNRQVVVMGGMWVPRDHYPASSKQSASQSGSPQGPLQLAGSAHAVSVTAGDSCEEDGKSESYSWK